MHAQLLRHVQFFATLNYSLPGSSVSGIFQEKILGWVAFPPLGDLPNPGIAPTSPVSPALAGGFLAIEPSGKPPIYEGFREVYFSQSPSKLH